MSISELREYWDRFSHDFVASFSKSTSISSYSMLSLLKLDTAKKVLEVGCGGGINAELMNHYSSDNTEFVLTDLSSNMVEIARNRLSKSLPNAKLQLTQANAEELEFADSSFDRYVASYVLHLTTDPSKMLSEAYRVLEDGGLAGFIVWGRKENSPQFTVVPETMKEVIGSIDTTKRTNFHLSDIEKTRDLILKAGFKNCYGTYSAVPIDIYSGQEFVEKAMLGPSNATLLKGIDEENKKALIGKVIEKVESYFQNGKLFGHEALILVAQK